MLSNSLFNETNLYIAFGIVMLVVIIFDLGLFQKKQHIPTFKNTLIQTGFWFMIACLFGIALWKIKGQETGSQFFSGYLMEWSLSADNIFVFILLLKFFQMPETSHQRVLFWGIIGAIVFRIIFISLGSTLVTNFHWILYIFGAILIYTGVKIFLENGDDDEEEESFKPEQNFMYKFMKKYLPFSDNVNETSMWVYENGKRFYTPLFFVICMIATTDVLFSIDSIPAVFSITQDKLVIFSSNIFAVMGLRSMFFLLSNIVKRFDYLQQGISFILIFIGIKMMLELFSDLNWFHVHISTSLSLAIIVIVLGGSILLSLAKENSSKKKKN
jgi:tellurite resistance protein TerC